MYADDTTLTTTLRTSNCAQYTEAEINNALADISGWLRSNKLSLNIKKTKFILFHHPNKQVTVPNLNIDGIPIEQVKNFKFLGLTINEKLNWNDHIDLVHSKISRAAGIINRLKNFLPTRVKLTLYNSLIVPHINYNLIVWGSSTKKISLIQKRAVRSIVNARYNSHTEPIFKQLKILTIDDLFRNCQLKFYYKYKRDLLPSSFSYLKYTPKIRNLRTKNQLYVPNDKAELAKRHLRYRIPILINRTKPDILTKLEKLTYIGFGRYLKNDCIENYTKDCQIKNCYVCNLKSPSIPSIAITSPS